MGRTDFMITDDLIASKGQRLGNYFIDLILQYAVAFAFGFAVVLVAEISGYYGISDWIQSMNRIEEYALGIVIMIFYYFLFENYLGRSPGKFVTKTLVVLEDGSIPDSSYILRRTLCRIIPFDAFSFLGSPSRGWHDSISDTYVVDKERFDEKMELHNSFQELGAIPAY